MTDPRALADATLALAVDAQTARVVDALRAEGVEPVLLKGPSFSGWLYASPTDRCYTDTDLLVADGDLPAAERALRGAGYLPFPKVPGLSLPSREWQRAGDGTIVDLHTRIWGWGDSATVRAAIRSHLCRLEVGGRAVTALDPAARAVHVVTHAVQDSTYERWTTQKRSDLDRALEVVDEDTWRRAARIAATAGAAQAFAVGLLGHPVGRPLARRLGLEWPAEPSPEIAYALAGTGLSGAHALDYLSTLPTNRARAGFLREKLLPPAAAVRFSRRAHGGGSGGGAGDYLWYWARLVRRLPGAVRARRAARRPLELP